MAETLAGIAPVLEVPGVLVVGSEVPNLIEPGAAATLVISQDVDIGVPLAAHARVKDALRKVVGFHASPEEPSVWLPEDRRHLEVNFVGMDPDIRDPEETRVLEDATLPLVVFGPLSLLKPGRPVRVGGVDVPVPRLAGLLLEKLLTERVGIKGDRDLLVALALLTMAQEEELEEAEWVYRDLPDHLRHAIRSGLVALSLLGPVAGLPDPRPHREKVAAMLERLEKVGKGS